MIYSHRGASPNFMRKQLEVAYSEVGGKRIAVMNCRWKQQLHMKFCMDLDELMGSGYEGEVEMSDIVVNESRT